MTLKPNKPNLSILRRSVLSQDLGTEEGHTASLRNVCFSKRLCLIQNTEKAQISVSLLIADQTIDQVQQQCIINNNNNNNNTPANVLENENFKLYWNRSILTDKTITFNRPDISFMNKKTKNTFLIDIAVPNTHNLAKTITDKQNKYQELDNEVCAMWKQKAAQVIRIVISTGVTPKSLSQSLTRLNLYPNTYIQLQKPVILGTCSIVRNFLNYK